MRGSVASWFFLTWDNQSDCTWVVALGLLSEPASVYEWKSLGALSAAYVPGNPMLVVTYNADGSVASTTGNGMLTTFKYNADGTVNSETRSGLTKTYTYDGSGNVTGASYMDVITLGIAKTAGRKKYANTRAFLRIPRWATHGTSLT
jgi:YD repeat-containing protein